jgi:hypothetical protein
MAEQERAISAVFLNVENTLGEVDQPGHFLPYRPSSQQLLESFRRRGLRIGAIVNIPADSKQVENVAMIRNGILSQDAKTGKSLTIGDFIASEDFVSNLEAGASQPAAKIFEFAVKKFRLAPEDCLFVGQDLMEVIGAQSAGLQTQLKQCPPGRDFPPALVGKIGESAVDSGREFQALLEHEHLLGERIFACGEHLAAWIAKLIDVNDWNKVMAKIDSTPPDKRDWISPPAVTIPAKLKKAMAFFVYLLDHFADQVHLKAEEEMLQVAVGCGMAPEKGRWVFDQHDQARSYWAALDIAWRRIQNGDSDDRWFALYDFQKTTEVFVFLFKAHAIRENYQTYTEAGNKFSAEDDASVMNLITHTGPADITPYVGMVARMEQLLGISPP